MKNKTFEQLSNYRERWSCSKTFLNYLDSISIILEDIKDDKTKFMEVFQKYQVCKQSRKHIRTAKILTENDGFNAKMRYVYAKYKRSPKTRNIKFDIDKETFFRLIQLKCVYCGGTNKSGLNGLDRVRSDDYYKLENVVPCCGICNMMKRDHSKDFFLDHIKRICFYTKS